MKLKNMMLEALQLINPDVIVRILKLIKKFIHLNHEIQLNHQHEANKVIKLKKNQINNNNNKNSKFINENKKFKKSQILLSLINMLLF